MRFFQSLVLGFRLFPFTQTPRPEPEQSPETGERFVCRVVWRTEAISSFLS
jgi:hypothetical protein